MSIHVTRLPRIIDCTNVREYENPLNVRWYTVAYTNDNRKLNSNSPSTVINETGLVDPNSIVK